MIVKLMRRSDVMKVDFYYWSYQCPLLFASNVDIHEANTIIKESFITLNNK